MKVDGFYQRLIKDEDGNCFMIARSRNVSGDVVDKYEWVPQIHAWMSALPNGTCLLAEAYLPGNEGSKNVTSILGCLKEKAIARQNNGMELHFHIFDCMAFDGKSLLNTPYESRIKYITDELYLFTSSNIHYTTFFSGEELWTKLQEYLASGREGMVIMRRDAVVYTKRTPARVSIKVKKELTDTIDCFIIGANPPTREYSGKEILSWPYYVDSVTNERLEVKSHYKEYSDGLSVEPVTKNYYYGYAGSLKLGLMKDGQPFYFGDLSGITDEVRQNWKNYLKKVVEVGGMEIFHDGEHAAIRHPKLISWREDKNWKDCEWSQLDK